MQTTPTLSQVAVLYGKDRYTILDIAQVAGIPVREGRLMLDEAIEHADGNWTRDSIMLKLNPVQGEVAVRRYSIERGAWINHTTVTYF